MYHTKYKLMVNGKGVKDFAKDHKEIVKAVLSCHNLSDLDRAPHHKINDELAKIWQSGNSRRQRGKMAARVGQVLGSRPPRCHGLPSLGPDATDPPEVDPELDCSCAEDMSILLCLHCNETMTADLIECGTCSTCYHFPCVWSSLIILITRL